MTRTDLTRNHPDLWLDRWPWPDTESHKHKRGHFGAVTGPAAATGAARLAARAGLRIGAGLVTLLSPPSATLVNAAHETSVMVKPFATDDDLAGLAAKPAPEAAPEAALETALETALQPVEEQGKYLGEKGRRAPAIGVTQGRTLDRLANTKVVQPRAGKLRVDHGDKLRPARQTTHPVISRRALDNGFEPPTRNRFQQTVENRILMPHGLDSKMLSRLVSTTSKTAESKPCSLSTHFLTGQQWVKPGNDS